jgi:hypothetical protein
MKAILVFATASLLFSECFSLRVQTSKKPRTFITQQALTGPQTVNGIDECKLCIDFSDQALNQLLNIILQGGVVGGCAGLCSALEKKTSPALGTVCNLLCDVVGIEEFVKIIQKADLDPIYYCELIPACPVNDNGDAKFDSFDVTPKSGPQGDFTLTFQYTSENGTGTGEIDLDVDTVDGIPLGQSFLHELAPAGTYNGQFKLKAEPDPDCDPTQGPCEQWLPGDYTVKIALCNGECGSKHPHSAIYDERSVTFTITDDNNSS